MTEKFLVQENKMSFGTEEVILVLTDPVHSSSCFLFHILSPEVIGRIIPLWIFTAFRACCQRESYLGSETAKAVQKAQIPGVLSQWLIMTWFRLAMGWIFKAHFLCVLGLLCLLHPLQIFQQTHCFLGQEWFSFPRHAILLWFYSYEQKHLYQFEASCSSF